MQAILLQPKTTSELELLLSLFKKMGVSAKTITDEEKEDIGLLHLMKQADRSKKVSREKIMQALA